MALPPPQPAYILRGHVAQVHALEFSQDNSHLLSGDAEGHVVCWILASKRARASWRAHTSAVLGLAWWTSDIIVTHGRDSKLHMWQLGEDMDTVLPVDKVANSDIPFGRTPTLFHTMTVNTLNFCAFTWIKSTDSESNLSYLLALPHTLSSEAVDIFQVMLQTSESDMPDVSSIRKTTIPAPAGAYPKTGLTMCLAFHGEKHLLAGYESGHSIVYTQSHEKDIDSSHAASMNWEYKLSYISQSHSQPILSIQSISNGNFYITTAADSILATHKIPDVASDFDFSAIVLTDSRHSLTTKHSGQQGLSIRSDGLMLATAGWDGRGRVYSAPIYRVIKKTKDLVPPMEKAVLKWHKEGCYCTAFAHIKQEGGLEEGLFNGKNNTGRVAESSTALTSNNPIKQITTAAQRREQKAQNTHWLALGSKDNKISLWDIM